MAKENRGLAALWRLDPKRAREIASMGGKAAHRMGKAHQWTSESARAAGRKGGLVSQGGRGRKAMAATGVDAGVDMSPAVDRIGDA